MNMYHASQNHQRPRHADAQVRGLWERVRQVTETQPRRAHTSQHTTRLSQVCARIQVCILLAKEKKLSS